MNNFLAEVIEHKKTELKERKQETPLSSFKDKLKKGSDRFLKALEADGLKIIAEIKPRSPSLGQLEGKTDPSARLDVYEKHAAAVSVLCDERYFGGSVALLKDISAKLSLPTLLKDFVIDPYQIYQARQAGAEAVLLIVKILSQEALIELDSLVRELGMTSLVEVQTENELEAAACIKPDLLLINNRNLDTLEIDLSTTERLVKSLKYKTRVVAASGIESADDLLALRPFASRFLIGSALMKSPDPSLKFQEFLSAETNYKKSKNEEGSCLR